MSLDKPMPLSVAIGVCFPHGGVRKTTMLAAIRSGRLACAKVGKTYMVTTDEVEDWIKSCHVKNQPGYGSGSAKAGNPGSSSSTLDEKSTQDIAEALSERLRNFSNNTRLANSGQIQAKVIRPKFRSRKS